jgi:hypothetical protein
MLLNEASTQQHFTQIALMKVFLFCSGSVTKSYFEYLVWLFVFQVFRPVLLFLFHNACPLESSRVCHGSEFWPYYGHHTILTVISAGIYYFFYGDDRRKWLLSLHTRKHRRRKADPAREAAAHDLEADCGEAGWGWDLAADHFFPPAEREDQKEQAAREAEELRRRAAQLDGAAVPRWRKSGAAVGWGSKGLVYEALESGTGKLRVAKKAAASPLDLDEQLQRQARRRGVRGHSRSLCGSTVQAAVSVRWLGQSVGAWAASPLGLDERLQREANGQGVRGHSRSPTTGSVVGTKGWASGQGARTHRGS